MKITFLLPPTESGSYCWLIEVGTRKLGVHHINGWCMQIDDRLVFIDSEEKCVPLAPLLDVDQKELFVFLECAAIQNPKYSEWMRKFPKELLIKHIFHTSFSAYWPEKALEWLADDRHLQFALKDELEKFALNKVMPQGVRQKAKRMVLGLS